jgi:hypothetical protein
MAAAIHHLGGLTQRFDRGASNGRNRRIGDTGARGGEGPESALRCHRAGGQRGPAVAPYRTLGAVRTSEFCDTNCYDFAAPPPHSMRYSYL